MDRCYFIERKHKFSNVPEGFELEGKTELSIIIHYDNTSGNHTSIFDFLKKKKSIVKY